MAEIPLSGISSVSHHLEVSVTIIFTGVVMQLMTPTMASVGLDPMEHVFVHRDMDRIWFFNGNGYVLLYLYRHGFLDRDRYQLLHRIRNPLLDRDRHGLHHRDRDWLGDRYMDRIRLCYAHSHRMWHWYGHWLSDWHSCLRLHKNQLRFSRPRKCDNWRGLGVGAERTQNFTGVLRIL